MSDIYPATAESTAADAPAPPARRAARSTPTPTTLTPDTPENPRDSLATVLARYALAVACVAAAAALWGLLPDVGLDYQHPFLLFTLALLVVAWFCGFGPTLLATAICAYLIQLLFLSRVDPPPAMIGESQAWSIWATPVAMLLFVLEGAVIGLLGEARLRQLRSLRRADRSFDERVMYRTTTLRGAVDRLQAEVLQRRDAEAGLHDANAELRTNAGELHELTRRLRQSNSELEEFASVASHDLQEPLRKIRAFGDRLAAKAGDGLDETSRDYLHRMLHAAERMSVLINDLLTFSRITSKAQTFRPVDLNEVVRGVLTDLEARSEELGATVEVGDLPTLDADPLQMRQLMQNLIGNAMKFHREGIPPRVSITAEVGNHIDAPPRPTDVGRVDTVLPDAGFVRISVADNGIGFDEKYLDRIFEVFQRLHGRTTYSGTGIGLAICRKIARRHGGDITATSAEGEGATFLVTLPLRHRGDEPDTSTADL